MQTFCLKASTCQYILARTYFMLKSHTGDAPPSQNGQTPAAKFRVCAASIVR